MVAKNIVQAWEQVNLAIQGKTEQAYRILVADSDVDMCHLSTEVLIEAGYDVGVVSDGLAAWDAIQFANYDLLVTENCLPEMSGLELLKNIHIAHIDLPVIMVIGASPAKMFHAPPWLQVEAMLVKPYTAAELLSLVKNVFYAISRAPDHIAWPQNRQEPPPTDGLRR